MKKRSAEYQATQTDRNGSTHFNASKIGPWGKKNRCFQIPQSSKNGQKNTLEKNFCWSGPIRLSLLLKQCGMDNMEVSQQLMIQMYKLSHTRTLMSHYPVFFFAETSFAKSHRVYFTNILYRVQTV